jgi:hypothetical protein
MKIRIAIVSGILAAAAAYAGIPDQMHPDYELKEVPLASKYLTMGMGFLSDGRLAIVTTVFVGGGDIPKAPSKDHKVLLISDPGGSAPVVTEVANNWLMPVGLTVVNDKIYISDRDGFYEIQSLTPNPADLGANRKKIASWPGMAGSPITATWNTGESWHQFVFTPVYWQGNFYAPYSGSIRPGGPSDAAATSDFSGAFLKWDMSGTLTKVAGGLRSPNGVNVAPNGDMFVCDNQGSWLPSSTFMLMKPGKFYGHRQSPKRDSTGAITKAFAPNWAENLPYERPTAWLDHGNLRSSPTQPLYLDKGRFAGDWIFGDENNVGLVRVALDKVDDIYNGAVFWFGKGTKQIAINRLAAAKDGSFYMGTIETIGNWPPGTPAQPIYHVVPKDNPASFDMKAVRSLADGIELEFTEAVDPATATIGNIPVIQWTYVRQEGYGQGKSPTENRTVSAVEVSDDKKRVHLKIAGLKDNYVTYFKLGAVKSASGAALWNNEAWFTLNKISTRTWNSATVAIAAGPKAASALAGLVRTRLAAAGLQVTLDAPGRAEATLRSLSGAALRAGSGEGEITLATEGLSKGVYLLDVRLGAEKTVRAVSIGN